MYCNLPRHLSYASCRSVNERQQKDQLEQSRSHNNFNSNAINFCSSALRNDLAESLSVGHKRRFAAAVAVSVAATTALNAAASCNDNLCYVVFLLPFTSHSHFFAFSTVLLTLEE